MWIRFFAVALLFLGACSSPEKKVLVSAQEQVQIQVQDTRWLGDVLRSKLHTTLEGDWKKFLETILVKLSQSHPVLSASTPHVVVFSDHSLQHRRFFVLPGYTVFVPKSFIDQVEFENELAAALAYQLAAIADTVLIDRVQNKGPQDYLKVFDFSESERIRMIRWSMNFLVSAHYDPRGLTSFFGRYQSRFLGENPDSESIQTQVILNKDEAARLRSEFAPQRDSVLRTDRFLILKRGLK